MADQTDVMSGQAVVPDEVIAKPAQTTIEMSTNGLRPLVDLRAEGNAITGRGGL